MRRKERKIDPAMVMSTQKLITELTEHNDFFDMIVDMIPSKLYIAGQSGDDYNPKNPYHRGVTKGSKEARKAEAKVAKRRKLDPTQSKSTVDQKEELEKSKESPEVHQPLTPANQKTDDETTTDTPPPHQSRIEALRAKLHAKIASKQGDRPQNSDLVSKRAARRAEKLRRQEDAVKRKKAGGSKVDTLKTAAAHYKVSSESVDPSQDLANLDFGRLSGLNKASENYNESNKSLANLSKSKNLKKILADAEAKREKLAQLKKGSEEDKAEAALMQWSETLKEADGQRVKDDPTKLKKVLKRQVAKKAKSQKAWKARTGQQADAQKERQKIRTHNLGARKEGGTTAANLSSKKIAVPAEKEDGGRRLSRAGFEGRKQEFLNKPKENKKSQ
jgi:hypothetical protein